MKKTTLLMAFIICASVIFGQATSQEYAELIKKAYSLYKAKEYRNSAFAYSDAFKANGWKGSSGDRYNAACAWSLSNYPDSAFFNLERIATLMNYTNYVHISTDSDLIALHSDKRWEPLLETVKRNKEKAEINFNKPLIAILDSILIDDQKYRKQLAAIEKEFGGESEELKSHWHIIKEKDSINLIKIKSILEQYGWLGSDVIGAQGNSTLFLVIQHSDQITQEKYLPMMREAVKDGKAQGSSLALLEDRVALGQGRRQVYGSQIGRDSETLLYYVLPLDDPDNVDKRRLAVGLQSMADYVSRWQLKWDVELYKKELLAREAKNK